jgi:hypothetical protein
MEVYMGKPKTAAATIYFRPLEVGLERLNYAKKIGIEPAKMMNDLLAKFGQKYLEEQKREIRSAIETPTP